MSTGQESEVNLELQSHTHLQHRGVFYCKLRFSSLINLKKEKNLIFSFRVSAVTHHHQKQEGDREEKTERKQSGDRVGDREEEMENTTQRGRDREEIERRRTKRGGNREKDTEWDR